MKLFRAARIVTLMIAAIAVVGALAKVSPATRMSRTPADMHALGDAANTAAAPATQKSPAPKDNSLPTVPEVEIVQHGGYPELHVGGHPFFLNSATFFYYFISHDRWNAMLDRYRPLGVNTIDIYTPWNWHEPSEGEFDFDGPTNPRRDLR